MSRSYRADDRYTTPATKGSHPYDPACDCRRCQHQEQQRLGQATREPSTGSHSPSSQPVRLSIAGRVQTFSVRGGW